MTVVGLQNSLTYRIETVKYIQLNLTASSCIQILHIPGQLDINQLYLPPHFSIPFEIKHKHLFRLLVLLCTFIIFQLCHQFASVFNHKMSFGYEFLQKILCLGRKMMFWNYYLFCGGIVIKGMCLLQFSTDESIWLLTEVCQLVVATKCLNINI